MSVLIWAKHNDKKDQTMVREHLSHFPYKCEELNNQNMFIMILQFTTTNNNNILNICHEDGNNMSCSKTCQFTFSC